MSPGTKPHGEPASGDELFRAGRIEEALAWYLAAAGEVAPPRLAVKIARCHERLGGLAEAHRFALAAADESADFATWQAAAALARRTAEAAPSPRRTARLAVLGSYTTSQLATMLWLAALRLGVDLELYESPYGQYRQEVADPRSPMYEFEPDIVLLAVHAGELQLPAYSTSPDEAVEAELGRWTSLWATLNARVPATVVQHLFALPPTAPFGHLGATLPGTRASTARDVNARLAASAPPNVAVVDCERLASLVGKRRWFDERYWHLAKQAVSLEALPLLALHTAAVTAARLGLGKKCIALDLDNTLWGGIVGEDGTNGIRLGETPEGEAFQAFQEALLALKQRGIILAVCSKNNDADAREVFERHPEMRLRLDDVAVFVADWRPKPEQLRSVARELGIGLEAIVFVDDNPVEREAVRRFLPEVDVIRLSSEPADYVRALDDYLLLEPASFTAEDARRTESYRARGAAVEAAAAADSIEGFYLSLEMRCIVSPFTGHDLPRVAQLVGKTNQFNLTTRRHSAAALAEFAADPGCVDLSFRLADRFTDHGLVGLVIAFVRGNGLEVDTWLMSCRVIGRSLEQTMLQELARAGSALGATHIRASYEPTAKNGLVRDLLPRLGFGAAGDAWILPLDEGGLPHNDFIEVERIAEDAVLHAA